jgi:hypothetical protein
LLSFSNLIEAHVLRSLRTEHGVSVKALRSALAYAENRIDAGETVEDIAADYDLGPEEIEQAALYERAA